MLSLPRTTKAVRRICVNPSHCLIFHQSKHSYFSRPIAKSDLDRYNNAGCRVTLLCWVVRVPVQPGGGPQSRPQVPAIRYSCIFYSTAGPTFRQALYSH